MNRMGRLLDEDDVIDAFAKLLAERCGGNRIWWKPVAEAVVNNLPPAQPEILACGEGELISQPERKKGKWILGEIETGAFNVQYQRKRCSECGWESALVIPRDFCPKCGADMR